jgi:hypothetical protein
MVLGNAIDVEKEVIQIFWSMGPGYKHVINIMET